MTIARDVATQAGALGVGAVSLAMGDVSGGGQLAATSLAALAALGLTLKNGCAEKACARAEKLTLDRFAQYPEITKQELERAKAILDEAPRIAKFDPKSVAASIHGQDFETELASILIAPLGIGEDDLLVRRIIEDALIASIAACKADTEFRAALTLELILESARKHDIQINQLEQIKDDVKDLKSKMQDFMSGKMLSLDDMITLAATFGEHQITDKPSLDQFLTKKAQEYRALRAEVDAIDEGLKRLSNLKAAAQGAIARVDLDEVEELLSRVQEVELEEAAKTAELRAENALLRGRVDQAYALLSAAADSFAAVDPLEPARRRLRYEDRLYAHGLRYGGPGMALSEKMIRQAISDLSESEHPQVWADAQNRLAIALRNQGTRTGGQAGADLLAQAVSAYRAALRVTTEAAHPVDWAMTQNNLANTLQTQGIRTDGQAGADLLAEAVSAYRAALRVTTEAAHPVDWAMTQNNLAIALQNQGTRTGGQAGADLLAEAVTAYRAALRVTTEAAHPVDWAMTMENIALALQAMAEQDSTEDPRPHLEEALTHVTSALRVYDPDHMSYNHDKATRLRDQIQAALDAL